MAPTTTLEEGEGREAASKPLFLARRRAPRAGGMRLAPIAAYEERTEASSSRSHRRAKRKRRRDAKEKRKKSKVADNKKKTEHEEAAPSASAANEEEAACSSDASSAVSSPLRWPRRPCITKGPGVSLMADLDPEMETAYEEARLRFHEKQARHSKLVTLDQPVFRSSIVNEEFLPVRDSATQIFLKAGKAVLGLSSYVDGNLLSRSSGFLVEWDKASKSCTILTSAFLIRSKPPLDEWSSDTVEYAPNAEVVVHLLDKNETTVAAHLLHYDKHFNVALFKIDTYISVETPSFCTEVMYGHDGFVLGRNDDRFLKIDYVWCRRTGHGLEGASSWDDLSRIEIYSIFYFSQVLTHVENNWLMIWYSCIPRLHMGMKFSPIKFLDPARVERISIKCNIDTGLIVNEVSKGSAAEKIGVRNGDIIESLNGVSVATTVELENVLLSICQNEHAKGKLIGSTVDVKVGVFHTRKELQCTKKLTLKLSDDMEIFVRGTYYVPGRGGFSSGRSVMMLA
ncbi:hypothetical protein EJB05_33932 [Eragrostis curvula]|uniref:PDZ domain-containing protein n=1 Tax=Eragrostis curvula TaxID=38414 RepID=A0A5J9U2D5_9POAL|nr:hypothetical protein EJB05_33932 [Eragrostis curvula]